jgi:hypothetical protein
MKRKPRIKFNIVNQNQYPRGVLFCRYAAPICESTRVAIVDQMRWVGSRFIDVLDIEIRIATEEKQTQRR